MASCVDGVKHYYYYNCLCYSETSVQGGRKSELMEYGSSNSRLVRICVYGSSRLVVRMCVYGSSSGDVYMYIGIVQHCITGYMLWFSARKEL